jgi:hypothetical protein
MKKILSGMAAGALIVGLWAAPAVADGHVAECVDDLGGDIRTAGPNTFCDVYTTEYGDIESVELDEDSKQRIGRSDNFRYSGTGEVSVDIWKSTYKLNDGAWDLDKYELEDEGDTETVPVSCVVNPAQDFDSTTACTVVE